MMAMLVTLVLSAVQTVRNVKHSASRQGPCLQWEWHSHFAILCVYTWITSLNQTATDTKRIKPDSIHQLCAQMVHTNQQSKCKASIKTPSISPRAENSNRSSLSYPLRVGKGNRRVIMVREDTIKQARCHEKITAMSCFHWMCNL